MINVYPSYYKEFQCIANRCKHNCCIGWEIDIDEQTYSKYSSLDDTEFKNNIVEDECIHFRLSKDDRCPFLNSDNLCDIILKYGENMLCQICTDHPRFKNFFDSRTEYGLGLCCEESARLILSYNDTVTLSASFDDNFWHFRKKLFSIIQDRNFTVSQRIDSMIKFCGAISPLEINADWKNFYLSLERLDSCWDKHLKKLDKTIIPVKWNRNLEIPYEQLLVYLIYRHLADALEDSLIAERITFIALSFYIIKALSRSDTLEELIEISRLYSSEIEYSDENIKKILDYITDYEIR